LSRRQIAKRLKTSVPQLYRLLDPANTRKSINQLVALLHVLNCQVDLVVSRRTDENTRRPAPTVAQKSRCPQGERH
jgi:hypothetical protein